MSDSPESARRMAEVSAQTGCLLRIGFMLRFQPAVIRLRAMLAEGEIGDLMSVRYHVGSLITLENSRSRYQSRIPGALVMDYIHGLDLLTWLTGRMPAGVYAMSHRGGSLPLQADPTLFAALLDFDGPLLAEIHMDYAVKPQLHELTVVGDRAMARIELTEGKMEIRRREKNRTENISFDYEIDDIYAAQMSAFLDSLEGGDNTGCMPEEGVLSTSLMHHVLEAAAKGVRVSIGNSSALPALFP